MEKFKSRKFWMAGVSALLVLCNQGLGLDIPEDTVLDFTAIVIGYLVSQGWVDAQQTRKAGNNG